MTDKPSSPPRTDNPRVARPPHAPLPPQETVSLHQSPHDDDDTVAPRPVAASDSQAGSFPTQLPAPFGRYRLVKLLGQGGMGAVYLAHDTQLDRSVALKVPHISAADGPPILERFYREARAAATLLHPNLCPVHDVGEIDGTPYLTMAYIEGKSLHDFAAARPLTPRQSAFLVRKLALALQEAHKRGVIHRDLKPANIMIDRRGEPIVMDFGLARRARRGDSRLTQRGDVLGTPAYMAPEQVSGDIDAMGPACDVYSLGVILYELLAGRLPFRGDPMAMLSQVLLDEPPPPSRLRPDLDPALESICLKAMAKKAGSRYVSMADFAAALAEYLRGKGSASDTATNLTPITAPPPAKPEKVEPEAEGIRVSQMGGLRSAAQLRFEVPERPPQKETPRRSRRKSRRRRTRWPWIAAGGGAVLVGVLSIVLALHFAKRYTGHSSPAASGKEASSQTRGNLIEPTGRTPGKEDLPGEIASPVCGPAQLLYTSTNNGNQEIYLVNEDGSGSRNLTNNPADDGEPAWSPDGTKIAFASNRTGSLQIWIMNADGSDPRLLTNAPGHNRLPTWAPDGKRLAFLSTRDDNWEIYVMDADGSHQTNLTRHPNMDADPAWSPDGRHIAFTSRRNGIYRVHVMDADGRNVRDVLQENTDVDGVYPAWSPDGRKIMYRARKDNNAQLFEVELATGKKRQLTRLTGESHSPSWSSDGRKIAFIHKPPDAPRSRLIVMDAGDNTILKEILRCNGAERLAWKPEPETPGKSASTAVNALTAKEKGSGWRLLFDGRTTTGWRGYNRPTVPERWLVENGTLVLRPRPGTPTTDLISDSEYGNFILSFEWKVEPGSNSGVLYRVREGPDASFRTGPEYQILDNARTKDGQRPETSAASCYALYGPNKDLTRPAGQWNQGRILVVGNLVEHWLNGVKVLEYHLNSPDWQQRVNTTRFRGFPMYGKAAKGHIVLLDQNLPVSYRSIKLRLLE